MKCVRRAMWIATGTSRAAATIASVKLAPRRSASDKRDLCGLAALERDHVVDGVVDGVARGPAGDGLQQRGVRAPVRDLLEAWLVGDLERYERDLRARPRARDDALRELEDRDLLGRADVERA